MTNIKEKLKSFAESVVDLSNPDENKIEDLIEKSNNFFNAQLHLTEVSMEYANSIKNFSKNEDDPISSLLNTLANNYEKIEKSRKLKVSKLKFKYISQLEDLLKTFNRLKDDIDNLKNAQDALEKAQVNYNKEKSKSIENQQDDKLLNAKLELDKAKRIVAHGDSNVRITKKVFKKEKEEKFNNILDNIITIEVDFYNSALEKISTLKQELHSIENQY